MSPLNPTIDASRHYGHRFPEPDRKRVALVLSNMELSPEIKGNIQKYNSEINPKTSYNYGKQSRNHRSRALTVEQLQPYLETIGWSTKLFLEVLQEENYAFDSPDNPDWHELQWPTEDMRKLCEILDTADDETVDKISDIIEDFLPESYNKFKQNLNEISTELDPDAGDVPKYIMNDDEGFRKYCTTKAQNLSDRIAGTLEYLSKREAYEAVKLCRKAGITYYPFRLTESTHYWSCIKLNQLSKISDRFKCSPHWLMFGYTPVTVLAKKIDTEFIMDKFSFLSDMDQSIIAKTVIKKYGKEKT